MHQKCTLKYFDHSHVLSSEVSTLIINILSSAIINEIPPCDMRKFGWDHLEWANKKGVILVGLQN